MFARVWWLLYRRYIVKTWHTDICVIRAVLSGEMTHWMKCAAQVIAGLWLAACSVGAPPGFSVPSGTEAWALPLVGPLENGILVTPVMVGGRGPYLFAIDPDSAISAVDLQIVRDGDLWHGQGPRRVDESDTTRPRVYAELLDVQVGPIQIDRVNAMVFPVGGYDTEGRRINGILGRDVLADSLVFGFDRDHGVALLSTVRGFRAPPGAVAVPYTLTNERLDARKVPAEQRRIASTQIDGASFAMHLDLGAVQSQLAEPRWAAARLAPVAVRLRLPDEAGSARRVSRVGIASRVALRGATSSEVTFAPYVDERFPFMRIDGTLGLDFFRRFSVFASWDNHTYYLARRSDMMATARARMARWGSALPSCPNPGCVTAEVIDSTDGPALRVVRDRAAAGVALEIGLSPLAGEPRPAVPLVVEIPSDVDEVIRPVSPFYTGLALAVVDVSPFPRTCPTDGGCVRQLGGRPASPDIETESIPASWVARR